MTQVRLNTRDAENGRPVMLHSGAVVHTSEKEPDVLGETFEFLNKASEQCATSNPKILDEFKARIKKDFSSLVVSITRLNSFQMNQLHSLLDYYRQSLHNVLDYDEAEREEFYMSVTLNLIDDLQEYLSERERMIKKRSQETLSRGSEKVANRPPFFLILHNHQIMYSYGRN